MNHPTDETHSEGWMAAIQTCEGEPATEAEAKEICAEWQVSIDEAYDDITGVFLITLPFMPPNMPYIEMHGPKGSITIETM